QPEPASHADAARTEYPPHRQTLWVVDIRATAPANTALLGVFSTAPALEWLSARTAPGPTPRQTSRPCGLLGRPPTKTRGPCREERGPRCSKAMRERDEREAEGAALELAQLTKRFGDFTAVDGLDL